MSRINFRILALSQALTEKSKIPILSLLNVLPIQKKKELQFHIILSH